MTPRVTVLGCGNSTGVPMANGYWGACDSAEPRNRRRRASILIEGPATRVLVDAGPDVHQQLIGASADRLDAVIFTHAHADHTQGIDDLRAFATFGHHPLPIYAYPEVLEQIRERFRYMFGRSGRTGYYDQPMLQPMEVPPSLRLGELEFDFFEQDHTVCRTLGIRIGGFAYSTDVKALPEPAIRLLTGLDAWVVSAVRREPHIAHAHLDEVLAWIGQFKPARAFLTHMNHTMDYRTLLANLPPGVEPAHDGLVIELGGGAVVAGDA